MTRKPHKKLPFGIEGLLRSKFCSPSIVPLEYKQLIHFSHGLSAQVLDYYQANMRKCIFAIDDSLVVNALASYIAAERRFYDHDDRSCPRSRALIGVRGRKVKKHSFGHFRPTTVIKGKTLGSRGYPVLACLMLRLLTRIVTNLKSENSCAAIGTTDSGRKHPNHLTGCSRIRM